MAVPGRSPSTAKTHAWSARKRIRLTLQLVSYRPGQVLANSLVPAARRAAPRLLPGREAWEQGTPRRDAPAQHPPPRPGPQPGARRSWPASHGATARAGARQQLQTGGCSAGGSRTAQRCPALCLPSPPLSLPASCQPRGDSCPGALPSGSAGAGTGKTQRKTPELGNIRFLRSTVGSLQSQHSQEMAQHRELRLVLARELHTRAEDARSLSRCLSGRKAPACPPLALPCPHGEKICRGQSWSSAGVSLLHLWPPAGIGAPHPNAQPSPARQPARFQRKQQSSATRQGLQGLKQKRR